MESSPDEPRVKTRRDSRVFLEFTEGERTEMIPGLFDLRTRQPVAAYRAPATKRLRLADTSLGEIRLYVFGCEPHRRLLARGPGARLREFGVDPAHDASWADYVHEVGPMPLIDPGRPAGFTGEKWVMPWLEWQAGDFSALPTTVTDERGEQAG